MGQRFDYMATGKAGELKRIMNFSKDGAAELRTNARNENFKVRDGFEIINSDLWEIQTGAGDLVELGGNTQGAGYLKISKSTDLEDTETVILSKFIVDSPARLALGMSLSQRLMHQRFTFGIVGVDGNGNIVEEVPVSPPVNISALSQTATTLTVTTASPHGFVPGIRIVIYGVADSRFNYGEVLVATVTSPTIFTVTTNAANAPIPSVTATSGASGQVMLMDGCDYANNAIGVMWEGANANNAKIVSRTTKGPIYYGTDTSFGSGHTTALTPVTGAYSDSFAPATTFDIRYKAEGVTIRTMPMDSTATATVIQKRTQVIPDIATGYKIRIRARNNKGNSRVAARVKTAVKNASTTAVITTVDPHGLTVGDQIHIYGIRDQTNFANLTTATVVASVTNTTTFTIAFGASATATSYGGVIIKVCGSYGMAPSAQVVQSVQRTANEMTVVGTATWTGFLIGETIDLKGLVDLSGNPVAYEGAFKVLNINATSLVLAAPGPDFALINCGGAVVKRTDLRLHLFRALDYTRHTVEVDGGIGNAYDAQEAIPMYVNGGSVTLSSGTVTTLSNGQTAHDTLVTGSPLRLGARALTANYAAVQTGDAADLVTTLVGALIQKPYSIPENDWSFTVAAQVTANTDQVIKAAPGVGLKNYLVGIQVINTGATATEFQIKDGTTVIYRTWLPASMTVEVDTYFHIPLKATANAALNFAIPTAGASVLVNAQGYIAP